MAASWEAALYTNRGFSAIDANGFLSRLSSWLGRAYANNGAGWTLIDDQSTYRAATFTVPDHTNDKMYSVGHNLITGQEITLQNSGGGLPTGLSNNNLYFVIRIDANNIKVATTLSNSLAGTNIDITGAGSGTSTFQSCPYMVYCNVSSPTVNQIAKFLKISYAPGFQAATTGYTVAVQIMSCLWWDSTNHVPLGIWNKYYLTVESSSTNWYYFVGNTTFIHIVSLPITAIFSQYSLGEWTSPSSTIVEGTNLGILSSGITAGGGVVTSLGTGQASYFTVGNYYFIYDMNGHSWVDYVKVTARDLGLDTITLENVAYNFPTGSVIGAYPHRYYVMGSGYKQSGDTANNTDNFSYNKSSLPYFSSTSRVTSNVFHPQTGSAKVSSRFSFYLTSLKGGAPDDEGRYYIERPVISEYYNAGGTSENGMRFLGYIPTDGGLYFTPTAYLTAGVTRRNISGTDYIYFKSSDILVDQGGDSSIYVLVQSARN